MTGAFTNHLWQSTLFAIAAALLSLAFRKNRAHVRYWIWFSVSIKFLLPLSALIGLGASFEWSPVRKNAPAPRVVFAVEQIAQPFSDTEPPVTPLHNSPDWKPIAILAVWTLGFAGIAWIRIRSWRSIRRALQASTPVDMLTNVEVRSSPGLLEPGVVGFLRSILLVPEGIQTRLTQTQLEAVLAHELCHVRRRDNLLSSIHMIVEAVFWFHPLVWWIGARLVDERERACDEEVLSLGSDPRDYAEAILNVCKLYVESPLACVSGITGASLNKRIEAILSNRATAGLDSVRKATLAAAGALALALPIALGIVHAPAVRAQSSSAGIFEVTSIHPCASESEFSRRSAVPGRLSMNCVTLQDFIQLAYVIYANGHYNRFFSNARIEGGPTWTNSERYTIDAKADANAARDVVNGPMLQALLEDRFKLKIHRETREVSGYSLTTAEGGPKLQPWQEGSCTPFDPENRLQPLRTAGQPPYCNSTVLTNGSGFHLELGAATIDELCQALSTFPIGRPIVNRTGLAGKFNFRIESTETAPGVPGIGPIFTAIQEQLGLTLEPSKGSREYLVIDHVDRP